MGMALVNLNGYINDKITTDNEVVDKIDDATTNEFNAHKKRFFPLLSTCSELKIMISKF